MFTADLGATLAALALLTGLFLFASRRASAPADPTRPRLAPWRFIVILSGFFALLAFVHLLNLAGIETGNV